MQYASERKDRLITTISHLGAAHGRNMLEIFMDEYGLYNLAVATEEQLQTFLDAYRRKDGKERASM